MPERAAVKATVAEFDALVFEYLILVVHGSPLVSFVSPEFILACAEQDCALLCGKCGGV